MFTRDHATLSLPSGTVTFLFTEVEGSTRLWAADKDSMSASLLVHDAILRNAIEGNGRYVFTTAGDSFAAAFGRASDAVRAATESQRALIDASWPGPAVKVRVGLHLGEAEERGGAPPLRLIPMCAHQVAARPFVLLSGRPVRQIEMVSVMYSRNLSKSAHANREMVEESTLTEDHHPRRLCPIHETY